MAVRLGLLAVALVGCRLVAGWDAQVGLVAGLGLALGLPAIALADRTGLSARLTAAETMALVPVTGMAAWAVPLALGLALHVRFSSVMWTVLVGSALALDWRPLSTTFTLRGRVEPLAVLLGGVLVAVASSQWQPALGGDALFHAGLIRKLLALPGISLGGVSPYLGGHPHAGYAFPLLHAVQAGAILLAGGDPSAGYTNLTPAFALLIPVAAYGAGRALANPAVGMIAATLSSWDSATRIVAGLVKEPPFFTFVILLPAAVVLLVHLYRERTGRRWSAWTVVAALEVAVVHPTYTIAVLVMIAAVVVLDHRLWPALVAATGVCAAAGGWVYAVALSGGEHRPAPGAAPGQLITAGGHALASSGQAILAHRVELLPALVATLVVLRKGRSPWLLPAALSAAMLALVAVPGSGTVLTAAVSGGQAERFWNAVPWIFMTAAALAAAVAVARTPRRLCALAVALAASSVLLEHAGFLWGQGGPRAAGWPAPSLHPVVWVFTLPDLLTTAAAVAGAALLLRRGLARSAAPSVAIPTTPLTPAALLLLALMAGPIVRDAPRLLATLRDGSAQAAIRNLVTPGVIAFLQSHSRARLPVVLAPYAEPADGIAYQIVGRADVYAVAISEAHSRATPRDYPQRRREDVDRFFSAASSETVRDALMARYRVDYVVFDLRSGSAQVLAALRGDSELSQVYVDPAATAPRYGRFVILSRTGP